MAGNLICAACWPIWVKQSIQQKQPSRSHWPLLFGLFFCSIQLVLYDAFHCFYFCSLHITVPPLIFLFCFFFFLLSSGSKRASPILNKASTGGPTWCVMSPTITSTTGYGHLSSRGTTPTESTSRSNLACETATFFLVKKQTKNLFSLYFSFYLFIQQIYYCLCHHRSRLNCFSRISQSAVIKPIIVWLFVILFVGFYLSIYLSNGGLAPHSSQLEVWSSFGDRFHCIVFTCILYNTSAFITSINVDSQCPIVSSAGHCANIYS